MSSPWTSVTATHLSRKAALYIRQSTLHQVQVHIGSTAVQMNQTEFIERLGWPKDRVWILDGDMGITGTSAEARDDWQLLHQAIARSEVGLVAFSATSRASRTHRDFAVLVGLCQLYDVLVLVDGSLVDPKIPSQRLLLGIRSVFDEYENDERIQRLRESKKALVKKGFAMSRPPVGYVSLGKPTRQWVKDPDPAVQQTITEVFTLYERLRSLRRVAAHLRDAGILLPANRRTGGGVVWRPALARSVARIVTNPHYAGYYCWGKKHASLLFGRVERGPNRGRAKARSVPREQWHFIDNHHEPYIEPDRFWRMRALAERSTFRHQQPPLRGAALVQGLVWCGDCDRRMYTRYWKNRDRIAANYVCPGPRTDPRDGHCRYHSARRIDPFVAARVLDVLRGLDLDLVRATLDRLRNESEARTAHLGQGWQIAEREAKTAEERLKAADPRNERVFRLLESELETALELPTGAGKTLIALLILDYWRREGKRVAILTGNKTLARQIESEAQDLRVPTVRFEGRGDELPAKDLRSYRRASAIAIMNYWVYINQNPTVDPADVLVLDDAQLAEGALVSLYSVRIGSHEHASLFEEAMKLFAQYTDSPVADDCVKGLGRGPWGPTDLVPFCDFLTMYDEFEALIDAELKKAGDDADWKDLRFRWGRLRPKAKQVLVFLSQDEILLRPYITPAQDFQHLAAPFQRIYMSATLHDPDDLRRRLGTPAIRKLEIPPELIQEEDGRRLFVFNQTPSPSSRAEPAEEVLVPLRELLKTAKKSVWLCSSAYEARHWRNWLLEQFPRNSRPPTWELTSIGDEFEDFSDAVEGHLFIAGRFEGMDFPDETCRLAVFPSLPRATGALERFVSEQLRDAAFQKTRMLERIKQGIGRCTRGNQDYAVYYFLDTRFYAEMESRAFAALQSERTRKQIELGLELTQDGMGTVVPLATKFLVGDFTEFDQRETTVRPPAPGPIVKTTAAGTVSDEVEGWRALFEQRNFSYAAASFEAVSARLADAEREHRGFWKYMEAFAEYLRHIFDEQPGALQVCLGHLERAILEGGSSSWFNRLRKAKNTLAGKAEPPTALDQSSVLDRWDELVEKYPHFKGRFLKWQAALKAYFDGTHGQVCAALQTLGHLLGFIATRPSGSGVADGFWVGREHAITLEAKIDVSRESVSLADVNQADGHRRAVETELNLPAESVAALIATSMSTIDTAASRALGTVRILSLDLVAEIQARLELIMRAYWKGWSRDDAAARARLRAAAARQLPPPGWLLRAIKSSTRPFLTETDLFREWPK